VPETLAKEKFTCPSCGAAAEWNPAKQALVCPYCGTIAPGELKAGGGEIEEIDLVTAMRSIPGDKRGWDSQKKCVKCQSCQAISVFDPARVAQRCDFCGSPALIPVEEIKNPIKPGSLLPFKVSEPQVRERIREWYGRHFFAPSKLKSSALTDTVHGLYLPYWTFDAQVSADWEAESGYHYYETETYRDANGRQQTRQVQRTRWVPSSGHVDHFFNDELVPASRGVSAELLGRIEPFPTNQLVPYDAGYLSGWVVEQYQIDLVAAAQRSREMMDAELQQLCAAEVPGDTHRNLQVAADYSGQTFKHILVPVWVLAYNYGAKSYQCVVNGYDGKIAGKYPLSWIKITITILIVLIALMVLLVLFSSGQSGYQ
jgi:Zn finger protein HypA/HybF involved in hydrogenase expression